jgi:predicted dehydrogenase
MLRVAIVGGGNIGQVHATCYRAMPDVQLVGLAEQRLDLHASLHERFGCPVFPSLEALLAHVRPDVLDICLPTPAHGPAIRTALAAGLRFIICEKPLARTGAEARDLVARCAAAGAQLFVGQVVRFFPQYVALREAIQRGDVGQPAIVRTSRGGPPPARDWYLDLTQSGGVIFDTLIHDFDWLHWTFGPVARVYARHAGPRGLGQIDYALVTLRFRNGVIAHTEGLWARSRFGTSVEVAGDQGLLTYDSFRTQPLLLDRRDGQGPLPYTPAVDTPGGETPFYRELRHFLDCMRGGARPRITPDEARYAVEIAEAALRSAQTGQPVALPEE